jgi:short-subunit dehydrogenase
MEQVQRIFITGAARGLGLELVKFISKKNPTA